jgi:hypothetical protein
MTKRPRRPFYMDGLDGWWRLRADKTPEQCSLKQHYEWKTLTNWIVGKTEIAMENGQVVEVSTVFLGLDHNFRDEGPPILFETMIFGETDDDPVGRQWRYATWAEAELGHMAIVETLGVMAAIDHLTHLI